MRLLFCLGLAALAVWYLHDRGAASRAADCLDAYDRPAACHQAPAKPSLGCLDNPDPDTALACLRRKETDARRQATIRALQEAGR